MGQYNSNLVTPDVLARIRRDRSEVEGMETKTVFCPHCQHKTLVIYEDASGHVQCRCKKCGQEAVYHLSFRIARRLRA